MSASCSHTTRRDFLKITGGGMFAAAAASPAQAAIFTKGEDRAAKSGVEVAGGAGRAGASPASKTSIPFRQVHLDFHTSPLIPDVARDFDPDVERVGPVHLVGGGEAHVAGAQGGDLHDGARLYTVRSRSLTRAHAPS